MIDTLENQGEQTLNAGRSTLDVESSPRLPLSLVQNTEPAASTSDPRWSEETTNPLCGSDGAHGPNLPLTLAGSGCRDNRGAARETARGGGVCANTPPLPLAPRGPRASALLEGVAKLTQLQNYLALIDGPNGLPRRQAQKVAGLTPPDVSRMRARLREVNLTLDDIRAGRTEGAAVALADRRENSGAKPKITFTEAEKAKLCSCYLRSNRAHEAGSMLWAQKLYYLDPETSDAHKLALAKDVENQRVAGPVQKILEHVTAAHFSQHRAPGMMQARNFSGQSGVGWAEKEQRLRILESDDGTANVIVRIPWRVGGDKCSDKWGWRVARVQILPMIDAGWTHAVLGYTIVFRPRGAYRKEDICESIHRIARGFGLPDGFRFERGSWESHDVTELLAGLGVQLQTVSRPTEKNAVEGFFSKLWTYLSPLAGQAGRFRGENETENKQLVACQQGRLNPEQVFPTLDELASAINGAVEIHNTDTIKSIYGSWVPAERVRILDAERPWKPVPPEVDYLFRSHRRERVVTRGFLTVAVPIMEGLLDQPFSFAHADLWRVNGQKVRVHFDPFATPCLATVVALADYQDIKAGQVICEAELTEGLGSYARAALGYTPGGINAAASRKAALAAVRRETHLLAKGGALGLVSSVNSDGQGNRVEIGASGAASAPVTRQITAPVGPVPTPGAPSADALAKRRERLRAEAALARACPSEI